MRRESCFTSNASVGQRSPHQESNLRPSDSARRFSTSESQRLNSGEPSRSLRGPHVTSVLQTPWISNIKRVLGVNNSTYTHGYGSFEYDFNSEIVQVLNRLEKRKVLIALRTRPIVLRKYFLKIQK